MRDPKYFFTGRWPRGLCIAMLLPCWLEAVPNAATQYVIVISVDGMGSAYVTPLLASGVTNELTAFNNSKPKVPGLSTPAAIRTTPQRFRIT